MKQSARQEMPHFLTIEELSSRMGKSTAWVYKYAARLGGVKIGGTWVFTTASVSRALENTGSMSGISVKRPASYQCRKRVPISRSINKRRIYDRVHLVREQ